jgi:hypothetical protein
VRVKITATIEELLLSHAKALFICLILKILIKGVVTMFKNTLKISRLKYRDSYIPKIRISALWLNDMGFSIGTKYLMDYSREHITLKLLDNSNIHNEFYFKSDVKTTTNKYKTISIPSIDIGGIWFSEIGFNIGDNVLITSEFGTINITTIKH